MLPRLLCRFLKIWRISKQYIMTQQVLFLWSLASLRNSCSAVWKSVQHQQFLLIYLLYLVSQYQLCECNQTNPNHRIQRRFMWKEMDVVDSMLRRMVSGSRFIKNIIGETAPKKYILKSSSFGNYLPIETTKVKYIFKDPLTKETKVITMRPSQKIIRPAFDYLVDNKPKTSTVNPKDKIRQMERDTEVLAEKQTSNKVEDNNNKKMNTEVKEGEVIRGKIAELDNSWQPMQLKTTTPSAVKSSLPPKAISKLHTSFMTESRGEKFNSATPLDSNEVTSIAPHTYEVTETDSEETIHLPFTNEYLSIPKLNNLPTTVTASAAVANTDNDGDFFTQTAAATTLSPIIVSTVDDETPNYPTYFLQRIRERPQSDSSYTTTQSINSTLKSVADNSWKLYQNQNEYNSNNNNLRQQLSSPRRHRNKSVKWASTEIDHRSTNRFDTSTSSTSTSPNDVSSQETANTTTESTENHTKNLRKNGQIKSSTAPTTTFTSEETSERPKQRGSVKFGNKIRTNNR